MEEAVAKSARLFWRGYERTSLAELTKELGIAPASFYFAFGSKEALFRRAVDNYIAFQDTEFDRAFDAPTPRLAVQALLRGYIDVVTDPDHGPGCLVVNSSPSMHAADALRCWLAEHRATLRLRLEARFRDYLEQAGAEPFDPMAMARLVVTLAGGLAVEAQSGAGREELHGIIELALAGLPDAASASS